MQSNSQEWIDVSATISDGMVHWPTDPAVEVFKAQQLGKDGAEANVTAIHTTAHVGTHIDAPLHFYNGAKDIADISLDILIGNAKVIHIKDPKQIGYDEIKDIPIAKGDRILFRTRNSDVEWERMPFKEDYVYLATDAAKYLVDRGVQCIGIDYLSLGSKENDVEIHRLILGVPIIIIEGLKLGHVEAGDYDMVCLPLKIKGSDGGPSRVILKKRNVVSNSTLSIH